MTSEPAVTYIVSAYDRPRSLRMTLASIQCQTDHNWECIVADNNIDPESYGNNSVVRDMYDDRFRYYRTDQHLAHPGWDCYWSAEYVVDNFALGQWLVLPSDDSYYVPVFQETMLREARAHDWELVYCDMLYDRRWNGRYAHFPVRPSPGGIDKTCFMLSRERWIGFPAKPQTLSASMCDGQMIEELVRRGIRHGRVDEVLVVHN